MQNDNKEALASGSLQAEFTSDCDPLKKLTASPNSYGYGYNVRFMNINVDLGHINIVRRGQ